MENRLDFLEQLLKRFFEPTTEKEKRWIQGVIQHILDAMMLHALPQEDDGYALPEIVRVYLSAEDEKYIPILQQVVHGSLDDLLTRLAADRYHARFDPLISFSVSTDLAKNNIKVSAVPITNPLEDTAVLTQNSPLSTSQTPSKNASLLFADGHEIPLTQRILNIGRNPENDLVLDSPMVSRHQAQIRLIGGIHHLFDIQSTGGTYINEIKIEHGILNSGDVIRFADQTLIYVSDASQSTNTPPIRDEDTQEIL